MDSGFTELKTGAFRLEVTIDKKDYMDIRKALIERQLESEKLPAAYHDDATLAGRQIAEICRGWRELIGAHN